MKVSYLLIILYIMTACSTHEEKRTKEFNDIEIGMSKPEVLEVAGPPHWSNRYDGYDRWIYYMQPLRKHEERVVYFRQGVVIQKGIKEKPFLSADEMEDIKKPRIKTKAFTPSHSDEQLRKVIKKEIKKESKKTKSKNPSKLEKI